MWIESEPNPSVRGKRSESDRLSHGAVLVELPELRLRHQLLPVS